MRNRKKLRQAEFARRGFSDRTVMLIGFLPQCGKLEFRGFAELTIDN